MSFIVHPSQWEAEHAGAIFAGQAYQETHDGALPDTPMWRMLEFRHTLNAARFDYWHPNVGLILEHGEPGLEAGRLSALHHPRHWVGHMRGPGPVIDPVAPCTPPPWSTLPRVIEGGTSTSTQPPSSVGLQSVPEPSAILQGLAAVALAWVFLARRSQMRRRT